MLRHFLGVIDDRQTVSELWVGLACHARCLLRRFPRQLWAVIDYVTDFDRLLNFILKFDRMLWTGFSVGRGAT